MKKAKILANISNTLVTAFLIVLIPATIIGTYAVVVNSKEIKENTRFRVENDSLLIQLRIEKRLNENNRKVILNEILNNIE